MTAANDFPTGSLNIIFSDAMALRNRIARRVLAAWGNPLRHSADYVPMHVCYRFLRYHQTRLLLNETLRTEMRHKTAELCDIADMFLADWQPT
jgi:hypothetical protein